jgi:DNA polymerase-4
MAVRTIMHIDLDTFFVSVEQVLDPELEGKPVVVGGKPDRRGVVSTASYEARAFGIHSGMPLITAVRLCPQAIFVEGNFLKYREYSRSFMLILSNFCPFLEPMGLDEAYLDATGFESIHGSIHQMALNIKQRTNKELGLHASIGIASCKVVAKIASDLSKPDGLIEVLPGEEQSFLAPLAINKLPGIGKKTAQVLKDMRVKTIGELSQISSANLKSYLGTTGEMLHRFANGIDDRPVLPPGEAKSISRERTFINDSRDIPFLEAILWSLSERVASDLRKQGKQAKRVIMKLRYADFSTITRSSTLPQATDADQVIFEAGQVLLERALSADKQPVRLLGIGVSNLVEPSRQLLMLNPPAERMEKLNKTIDRIRDKYGFSTIQTGRAMQLKDVFKPK